MSNEIQWTPLSLTSAMSTSVLDNDGIAVSVLDDSVPFKVAVAWSIPPSLVPVLGGSFRVRVFAESMGPGQEKQVGADKVVAVSFGGSYSTQVDVPAGSLQGEGTGAPTVSGVYKIVTVLQHLNPGATSVCGYAEGPLVQIRTP